MTEMSNFIYSEFISCILEISEKLDLTTYKQNELQQVSFFVDVSSYMFNSWVITRIMIFMKGIHENRYLLFPWFSNVFIVQYIVSKEYK